MSLKTNKWRTRLIAGGFVAALLLSAVVGRSVLATPSQMISGTINTVGSDRLTMTVGDLEMSFMVAPEAMIKVDGRIAMLGDLKPGFEAQIAAETMDDGMMLAMDIEASSGEPTSDPQEPDVSD